MVAENNVKKFLKCRRDKNLWDRISTVFQFHRDEENLALYSQLYEWALEDPETDEEGGNEEPKTNGGNDMEMTELKTGTVSV